MFKVQMVKQIHLTQLKEFVFIEFENSQSKLFKEN